MKIEEKREALAARAVILAAVIKVVGNKRTKRAEITDKDCRSVGVDPVVQNSRGERDARITVAEYDDRDERVRAEKLATRIKDFIRTRCTGSFLGYLTNPERAAQIMTEAEELERTEIAPFNASAVHTEIHVRILKAQINLSLDRDLALAIADEIRGDLADVRDSLRKGNAAAARAAYLRCKHSANLAIGPVADAIGGALVDVPGHISNLGRKITDAKGTQTPESIGRTLFGSGAAGDTQNAVLGALANAIEMVTPSDAPPETPPAPPEDPAPPADVKAPKARKAKKKADATAPAAVPVAPAQPDPLADSLSAGLAD